MTDAEWEAHFTRVEATGENADPVKPYPDAVLNDIAERLLDDWGLSLTEIKNLAADLFGECESIEQDRNERAWERMSERQYGCDDSSYRRDMQQAGRGHLLK